MYVNGNKKKIIPRFYVLLKKVLKVNVMTVGVHKAGPDKLVSKLVPISTPHLSSSAAVSSK